MAAVFVCVIRGVGAIMGSHTYNKHPSEPQKEDYRLTSSDKQYRDGFVSAA